MRRFFGYQTAEEIAAKAAAEKAAAEADKLAKQRVEIIKRQSEAAKFQNEQLMYRLNPEREFEVAQKEPVNKHAFLKAKKPTATPAEQTVKEPKKAEEGVVTSRAFTFVGPKMFESRVVKKQESETAVLVNAPALK